MKNKFLFFLVGIFSLLVFSGCYSRMPLANKEETLMTKQFNPPPAGKSGLYLYRDIGLGVAVYRTLFIDDEIIAVLRPKQYKYIILNPGIHKISTTSEFGHNHLKIDFKEGKNYFVKQYMKIGVFLAGSNIVEVKSDKAMKALKDNKFIMVK
ncbi:DUF2846 domain-containing protein [Campylobacter sp. FMV-PI01]|uniref:DUF2846 domain-containing protein n=1 Tax=Campylobacter portucalensis TaxID=2608384 RepID=A0A6L5WL08_9BACT|nr:DUF2846 domain-containing protein [Campylobacter portucalensis]MSN96957.1 DUF2846 domain-containing protein [Campylobacter portucalensis]